MTADQFRRLAISLPGAEERATWGTQIFALVARSSPRLDPDGAWGMVKLTPKQQALFVQTEPKVFVRVKGAWGRRGCTNVCLKPATNGKLFSAMIAAWRNIAPKDMAEEFEH